MDKLGWNVLKNEDKLWVRMLKVRYWRKGTFLTTQVKTHHFPIWKDIAKGREILEKGIKRRIGSGKDTSLWFDWWVGRAPLVKVAIKNVPDSIAHWKVCDIIYNGTWDISRVKDYIPMEISNEIVSTPLSLFDMADDDYIWYWEKKVNFSVKSAYHLACDFEDVSGGMGNWNMIWKLRVPFKYKLLI